MDLQKIARAFNTKKSDIDLSAASSALMNKMSRAAAMDEVQAKQYVSDLHNQFCALQNYKLEQARLQGFNQGKTALVDMTKNMTLQSTAEPAPVAPAAVAEPEADVAGGKAAGKKKPKKTTKKKHPVKFFDDE